MNMSMVNLSECSKNKSEKLYKLLKNGVIDNKAQASLYLSSVVPTN